MRFAYAYKTSDGKRHECELSAKDRESVFVELKRQGIKPIKVWPLEKPPVSKRTVAIVALSFVLIALIGLLIVLSFEPASVAVSDLPRDQLVGDQFEIFSGAQNDWGQTFDNVGDRWLARYAQPGIKVKGGEIAPRAEVAKSLGAVAAAKFDAMRGEKTYLVQLKGIVQGMKSELRTFLSDGGTVEEFMSAVEDRQRIEAEHFEKAVRGLKAEVEKSKGDAQRAYRVWMLKNMELQSMGMRAIPMPEIEIETEK